MSTHTPAEWAAAGSLGLTSISLIALALAFADADAAYFDPRPAARRALAAAHQGVVHAGHDLNRVLAHAERAAVHAAITAAAALALLLPATGGTR
ncbi:hypothetical protein ACIGCZ_36985 [Streptomyces nigra]|uniref:hypothetical protein n=1 Tax=Streptomyces nigra TaxID=1827580 RepID=UPI0037D4CA33